MFSTLLQINTRICATCDLLSANALILDKSKMSCGTGPQYKTQISLITSSVLPYLWAASANSACLSAEPSAKSSPSKSHATAVYKTSITI